MARALRMGVIAALVLASTTAVRAGEEQMSATPEQKTDQQTAGAASGEPYEKYEKKADKARMKEELQNIFEERAFDANQVEAWYAG